jgi:ABC-type multidrug transport system fused ATPase/permease subunit
MAWLMICIGVLSGLLSAGVLALINHLLHHPSDHSFLVMLGFLLLVAGKILSTLWSKLLLVRFSQDTILDISLSLCAKIVRAPLRRSEQRGAANILVTLTDDVSWVTWAIQCFPQLIMNVAVVLGCGFYLAWLSWGTFLGVVGVTMLGALGYQWLHTSARARSKPGGLSSCSTFSFPHRWAERVVDASGASAGICESGGARGGGIVSESEYGSDSETSFVGSLDSGLVLFSHRIDRLSLSICGDGVP